MGMVGRKCPAATIAAQTAIIAGCMLPVNLFFTFLPFKLRASLE